MSQFVNCVMWFVESFAPTCDRHYFAADIDTALPTSPTAGRPDVTASRMNPPSQAPGAIVEMPRS